MASKDPFQPKSFYDSVVHLSTVFEPCSPSLGEMVNVSRVFIALYFHCKFIICPFLHEGKLCVCHIVFFG